MERRRREKALSNTSDPHEKQKIQKDITDGIAQLNDHTRTFVERIHGEFSAGYYGGTGVSYEFVAFLVGLGILRNLPQHVLLTTQELEILQSSLDIHLSSLPDLTYGNVRRVVTQQLSSTPGVSGAQDGLMMKHLNDIEHRIIEDSIESRIWNSIPSLSRINYRMTHELLEQDKEINHLKSQQTEL